ncbi:recombination regulator RecX [Streptomyces sp. NPDC102462]|uniref:recombination regulator RecX n=1 Tax=Streptomyces sp. NPDC102462 TaxID=3366178 RepID=UPI0038076F39
MTRRTDWAEYAHLDAHRERTGRGGVGPARPGDGPDGEGAFADDRPFRGEPSGGAGAFDPGGPRDSYGDEPHRGRPHDEGRHGDSRHDEGPYGGGSHGEGTRGVGPYGGGPRGEGPHGGGPPGGGRRGGGPRGRRRRGFGGPADEDGGSFSLSRAEQEESPGDPAERARAICLRLLTGTPRTRKQLADALRKKEIPDDVAEEVLSRFEEVGLIDDSAFADAWVESRHHGRGLARRALARELRTKGVDSALIDEAVARLDAEQEESTARDLVARKLRSTRGLDRDRRIRRLAGMLARKGYPEGMALRVVRQALEEEGEDTDFLDGEEF